MAYLQESTVDRATFLKRSAAVGGGLAGGGTLVALLPRRASSAPSREQDARILAYLLEVEQLQAAFYADAVERGQLDGELLQFAEVVGEHERMHVSFIEKKLGGEARAAAEFDFADTTSDPQRFATTALALEEAGAAAYIGQGANLTGSTMTAAARIVSVEARHTAWIRAFLGRNPAPRAADPPKSEADVRAALQAIGFVEG